jgi:hypothetical protein
MKQARAECDVRFLGVRMTKFTLLLAMGVASLSAPALAQHSGHATSASPSMDPCVLGTNAQPGACVGPVRVAPVITSQGSVQVARQQQTYTTASSYSAGTYVAPQAYSGMTTIAHHQAPLAAAPVHAAPMPAPFPVSGGCVQGQPVAMQGCNGHWVYSNANTNMVNTGPVVQNQGGFVPNGYSQQHHHTSPQYASAPVVYQQAPVVYQQAPVYSAPVQYAPVQYAPVHYAPQPQPVTNIPTSFFTGGITYGAGYPEGGGYSYGGGGAVFVSGGGTRFSGVRERSPTPLIAPPMRRNQPRHAPPPKHCGHC